jgi:uncharacterized protein (DUF1330 family)
MPAYVIADVEVLDPEPYAAQYSAFVADCVARHGGRFLVRGGDVVPLEGDWRPGRLVVIEFPDLDALHAWYDSDEYRALAEVRRAHSRGSLVAATGYEAARAGTSPNAPASAS